MYIMWLSSPGFRSALMKTNTIFHLSSMAVFPIKREQSSINMKSLFHINSVLISSKNSTSNPLTCMICFLLFLVIICFLFSFEMKPQKSSLPLRRI